MSDTPEPLSAILAKMRGRILGEDRIKYTLSADEALAFVDSIEVAVNRERAKYERLHDCFWNVVAIQNIVRQMLDECDELTDKTRNYEDVIAHHKRTEEHLRDLVKRLLMLRRGDIAVPMDMEKQILAEARAAIGEDKE